MMLDMIGAKLNSRYVGAATACLVALALFVGPLCRGMCAGSTCLAQAANSNDGTGCHGMAHGRGSQFSARDLGGTCRATVASLAVAGKPDFSVKCVTGSCEQKVFPAEVSNVGSGFDADSKLFLSSDGPPLRNPSSNVNGVELRI
jgi:hypothetical protein